MQCEFEGELWLWQAEKAAWHFVSVPKKNADEIRFFAGHVRGGWGSIPVTVTIGETMWKTSIFPHKEKETFILPIKKAVRVAEGLREGEAAKVRLEIVA